MKSTVSLQESAVLEGLVGSLSIACAKVNGVPCTTLLDSGSQMTVVFDSWYAEHTGSSYPFWGYIQISLERKLLAKKPRPSLLLLWCARIPVIPRYKQPKDLHYLQSFLRFYGYYRRFIKNYSIIVRPLLELCKDYPPFQTKKRPAVVQNKTCYKLNEPFGDRWDQSCMDAFQKIIHCLSFSFCQPIQALCATGRCQPSRVGHCA